MKEKENLFTDLLGQTNPFPFKIEVERASGSWIYATDGKKYLDLIAGVAVNNIGHCHPKVLNALKEQIDKHLHVMVYGEFIQNAQLNLAQKLTSLLPKKLNAVYPVNSGTEANEAAIKLVKRITNRTEIISFRGSYHGSTNGSLSVSGNEIKKQAYRPLLPNVKFLIFNDESSLKKITNKTAGVIIETIQGDAGVRIPSQSFLKALRKKCDETGTLLIFDEIQCGIGRTGKNFAFEHFDVIPDILTLGKALGGGMSIGALVSNQQNLLAFTENPMLGHITTFGGHPVNCAAAHACLEVLTEEINFDDVEEKAKTLHETISKHPDIKASRRIGMMYAFDMESEERVARLVGKCLEKGVLTFWFLSHPYSFRLSPPLTISQEEIALAGKLIYEAIEESRIGFIYHGKK